jgi:16S rRNA (guanine(966)-N(2))-methyltransferase RsmD
MRIIAGEKKGFVLKAPRGQATRPTLGRVRESLFNILRLQIAEATVLDLYAGAGTLGLEALSRGAAHCVFVDRSETALAALRANVEKLGYQPRADLVRANVANWLAKQGGAQPRAYSLVFSDPPYDSGEAQRSLELVGQHLQLAAGASVVVQTSTREKLPDEAGHLRRFRVESYGDTVLHFYGIQDWE